MLVIGLTGGIGSGKSTVAHLFAAHHVPIIDADVIARKLTNVDQPAYLSILEHFGNDILLPDYALNRAKLRQIIFKEQKQKVWLENLLHPLVKQAISHEIDVLQKTKPPVAYCIVVIPLLFEANARERLDRILVVDVDQSIQIERVKTRDKNTLCEIEAILNAQIQPEERIKLGDDIITNNGDMAILKAEVNKYHQKYYRLAASSV